MVLQGSQVQSHSAKQIANSWILHSAAAAACAKQKSYGSFITLRINRYVVTCTPIDDFDGAVMQQIA